MNWRGNCGQLTSAVPPVKKKSRLASLRVRLVGTVFIAVLAGWIVAFFADLEIAGFAAGILALVAAWFGGEWFVMRQIRSMLRTTTRLARGDFNARTGAGHELGELGDLARTIDSLANMLTERSEERQRTELSIQNRAQQQAAVAALGQFTLTSNDLDELMHQAVTLVAQTLEVDLCEVLESNSDGSELFLRAGVGWTDGLVGVHREELDPDSLAAHVINTLEAIRVVDYRTKQEFNPQALLRYHGAISGMVVPITGRDRIRPYGVMGAHCLQPRLFTDDDEQFLRAVANLLAMSIDRKRAEAEMEKRAWFAQLNPTPAIELNLMAEVTYANDAALKLASDVNCATPRDLLPENIHALIDQALASGEDRLETNSQMAGRTLSWLIHPVPDNQSLHCYITDITEREKMEINLRQADKMLAIGQLAAGVAHDFNNMLTVIQGHAGILMQQAEQAGTFNSSAQAIYFAAERASGLTRQLLMFSRKNVKQFGQLQLSTVVRGMFDMLKRLLGETITLEFATAPNMPSVEGDRNELEQVIMNLVVNARDAMPHSVGQLRIELDVADITEEHIALQPQARVGRFACLRVTDSGCGMDQATVERIFEPFFTTKEVGKGTGLGLATVYGIVNQHAGWIEVESEVGKGTTFTVFFPATINAVEPAPATVPEPAPQYAIKGNETVLIVEDEDDLREMAVLILESFGYSVLSARSGPEAFQVWADHTNAIQIMVTDMVMPGGMTGLQLAETLIEQQPNLPVVITSGYSVEDISEKLSGNPNIRFVQKPYSPTALAQAVRNSLDGPKKLTASRLPALPK
jgi:signal transduction histidine kinase/HAMP domain-containing protein